MARNLKSDRVSSDLHRFPNRLRRRTAQPFFTTVLEDQLDCLGQTGAAFVERSALPVGAGQ
ncbi:MAG: hypothetical protein HYS13_19755 [Planctomycetia bacterium]|nr:hypothetical protein [Planctomycetia bacterium]